MIARGERIHVLIHDGGVVVSFLYSYRKDNSSFVAQSFSTGLTCAILVHVYDRHISAVLLQLHGLNVALSPPSLHTYLPSITYLPKIFR